MASGPGISPMTSATHTGLSKGSIALRRERANAGQVMEAFTNRIYARPNWKTPKMHMLTMAMVLNTGFVLITAGNPMRKATA